ncbi:MAG: YdcF family protein [Lachnospiraceae bacterium]|nr:YdcF family protein [Lachnospiraceae bacterium]
MKKRLLILAVVTALLLCLFGAAEETDEEAPGWKITASSQITLEARAAFDRAAAGLTDATYEPVALLGVQGDVYCILCRVTVDLEDAEPYYTLVYVGENGVQNIWDLWVESHSEPERSEEEEEVRKVDTAALLTDLAAEKEARDLVAEDMKALGENKLAAFIAEKWNDIYFDPDYRLYIDGKDDPGNLPVSGKHAFMVLGFELENGQMRDELKARCEAAAAAADRFPGSILVCSGGATGDNNPESHTEAGLMKEYLVGHCGIAPERVCIDESAMTTLDNAVNTFSILKDRGIDTITVVTSSYHQRRANILYETLAEIIRRTEGVSITVIGNYGCEAQAEDALVKYDARIAAMQLNEMLTSFLPEE